MLGVDLDYKADRDYERATKFLSIIATMIAQAIKVDHLIESDKQRLLDENIHLKQELRERYDFSHIIGNSGPLRQVYEQVTQVARTNTTVLLRGESGAILRELFAFGDLTAGEVMVPRVLLVGIPLGAPPDELRAIVRASAHTRYPVYKGDLDNIVGSLHIKQNCERVRRR